ncbi:MAG: hypothetical protein KAS71_10720 [Bacteroidales bacterium]|nr:hypothetical protein [Bacteroidales bacterium]
MKRIAIPIKEGKLSEYFGQCGYYEIFEIENNSIQANTLEVPPVKDIDKLPDWIVSQGITDVIAHKIDKSVISLFSKLKVNLFIGIPINTTNILVDDCLNGQLKSDFKIIKGITG